MLITCAFLGFAAYDCRARARERDAQGAR